MRVKFLILPASAVYRALTEAGATKTLPESGYFTNVEGPTEGGSFKFMVEDESFPDVGDLAAVTYLIEPEAEEEQEDSE